MIEAEGRRKTLRDTLKAKLTIQKGSIVKRKYSC